MSRKKGKCKENKNHLRKKKKKRKTKLEERYEGESLRREKCIRGTSKEINGR